MATSSSFSQCKEAMQERMTPSELRTREGNAVTVVGNLLFIAHSMAPMQYHPASPNAPRESKSGLTLTLFSRNPCPGLYDDEL